MKFPSRLLLLILAAALPACGLLGGGEVKVIDGSRNKVIKLEDLEKKKKKKDKDRDQAEAEAGKPAASDTFLTDVFGEGAMAASEGSRVTRSDNIVFAKWETNPSRALGKARALDRPLLLLFTALEWSPNARKLGDEVFASKTFNDFARENLVLTYLDYPRDRLNTPDSMRQAKDKFSITGYPTLLVLNPDGSELFRKTGFLNGRARDYFAELRQQVLLARGLPYTPLSDAPLEPAAPTPGETAPPEPVTPNPQG